MFSFSYSYGDHRDLHSFPTRRSSDLPPESLLVRGISRSSMRNADGRSSEMTSVAESAALISRMSTRPGNEAALPDRKSTRLNSSHLGISYAVFCLKKKKKNTLNIVN